MRNILIISEDNAIINQLASFLKKGGFSHVHTACDCTEVLSMVYRLNPKFIIVDMELSTGCIENLLKLLSGPLAQIILFIAPQADADASMMELIKKGFSRFIVRPVSEPLFLKTVAEMVESAE